MIKNSSFFQKSLNKFIQKLNKSIRMIIRGHFKLFLVKLFKNLTGIKPKEKKIYLNTLSTDSLIILTTKHTYYVANLIYKQLADLGYYAVISEVFSESQDLGQLHFVICPQMFAKLPKNFIAFQMEQSVNSQSFTHKYFNTLKRSHIIFDYSVSNIEYLIANNILYSQIFYLPIGSFANYRTHLESKIGHQINVNNAPIEVLFYGDPNCKRRQIYLEKLKSNFNVYIASEVFGEEMVSLICRAKVVVNIHYYENDLLETTHIYEILSLGTPIVSEFSVDINSHPDLDGIVSFTPVNDVEAMISAVSLLLNEDTQTQRRESISNFVEQDKKFSHYFKRFLLSNDLFDYDLVAYEKEVDFISLFNTLEMPRLCLSLTETTVRKSAFLKKPKYGFEIVEGIRYYQGWLGCGMSYKYILNKVQRSGFEYACICEDDVIFPDNFGQKINNIISYLKQTKYKWHIFSGLIASLHPDINILAIEEYEGVEYIYIDRMTSTVMNIYSLEIMKIISLWDHTYKNKEINTIDRYLESQVNLIVVTIIPYLVGHAEDMKSTIWEFSNNEYVDMIELSQKKLEKKVSEYKSRKMNESQNIK